MLVLLVLSLLCGLGIGLARGGTIEALGRVHVFRPWLFAALVLALAVGRLVPSLHSASWIVGAVLAALFAAANNRLPGLGLLVVGVAANAAVVLVNHGQMPVSLWGADRAGVPISDVLTSNFHSPADHGTSLRLLSDIIPLPFPGVPAVLSLGDVAIAAGLGQFGAVTPLRARRTLQARRHGLAGSSPADDDRNPGDLDPSGDRDGWPDDGWRDDGWRDDGWRDDGWHDDMRDTHMHGTDDHGARGGDWPDGDWHDGDARADAAYVARWTVRDGHPDPGVDGEDNEDAGGRHEPGERPGARPPA